MVYGSQWLSDWVRQFVPVTSAGAVRLDEQGHHGLKCKFSAGRRERHDRFNKAIQIALGTSGFSTILEPKGLDRHDGKRPDGLTLVPWERGRCLVFDSTIVDTMADTYLQHTSKTAEQVKNRKIKKYEYLGENFVFVPLAFETFGSWGDSAKRFIQRLGQLLKENIGESRALEFLKQRLSIELQRGNATSVLGTVPEGKKLDEIFLLL